jgi:hypothetical protein
MKQLHFATQRYGHVYCWELRTERFDEVFSDKHPYPSLEAAEAAIEAFRTAVSCAETVHRNARRIKK